MKLLLFSLFFLLPLKVAQHSVVIKWELTETTSYIVRFRDILCDTVSGFRVLKTDQIEYWRDSVIIHISGRYELDTINYLMFKRVEI